MEVGQELKGSLRNQILPSKFIKGLRVTDKSIINIVEKVLIDFNNDIVNSLNEKGSKLCR